MSKIADLIAIRAFEEAARRAWADVYMDGKFVDALYGAAAYLWLNDQHNTGKMLDIASDHGSQGVDIVGSLAELAYGRGLPAGFPSKLNRVFAENATLSAFVVAFLVKLRDRHGFTFAAATDWRPLSIPAAEFDILAEAVLEADFEAGAHMVAQYAKSLAPEASTYLPPKRFVTSERLPLWHAALIKENVPENSRLAALLGRAFMAWKVVHQPQPPSEEEIFKARTFLLSMEDLYPLLVAHLLLGLARKGEETLPVHRTLDAYRHPLRMLDIDDGGYRWIRQEMVARAQRKLGLPAGHEAPESAPELRLLILGCVAAGEVLAGVILADALRREFPHPTAAIFAAWICLCLGASSWSEAGFGQLTYVPPEVAGSFPRLPNWPFRPVDQEQLSSWLNFRKEWPRISVVVPSYQQGRFLEETLLSLLHQGYPNLEILLEDGGSTDESVEIIDRYRSRLDHVRSGPDDGQSHALDQGLRRASGELLGWLNSDDMLAPFALFHIAQAYLTGGELVVGSCFEFGDDGFIQMNLPGLPVGPLQQRPMADLKNEWFMGKYFYQPEVFFSADVFHRAGGRIDRGLHYTMDYDLWMRLAGVKAKVVKATWPTALFRRHGEQKTSNLDRTVIEQGNVRARYVTQVTRRSHIEATKEKLSATFGKSRIRILVATGKYGRFFPVGYEKEIEAVFASSRFDVDFRAANASLDVEGYDLVICLITLTLEELAFLRHARASASKAVFVGWFWDNHHMFRENLEFAYLLDVGIAGHDFARSYLEAPAMWLLPSILLCYTQWSERVMDQLEESLSVADRSDDLYGGFVCYPDVPERARQIEVLRNAGGFSKLRLIDPNTLAGYYDLSQSDRLVQWSGHKVSLAANVERDVPIRFFDALVTGQIPILPSSALDEPLLRQCYPDVSFVTSRSMKPDDVREAYASALAIFDAAGLEGAAARAKNAREQHSFVARLREILHSLEAAADG